MPEILAGLGGQNKIMMLQKKGLEYNYV